MLALATVLAMTVPAQADAGAMTSAWFAHVGRSATHGAPLNDATGNYLMETIFLVLDKWVTDELAVGGALTIAYGNNRAPVMTIAEARVSGRVPLNDRLYLVGVASVGFPQTQGYKASAPSLGADVGLGIRLGGRTMLRTDVGAFRAAFKTTNLEVVGADILDVDRRLSVTAVRITAGVVVDF